MIINHDDDDDETNNNNDNNNNNYDRYNGDDGGNDIGGDNRMEKEKMDLQFVTMIIYKYHRIISIINQILIIIVDKYNIRSRNSIMKMIINETYLPIEKIIFSYQNNYHNDNVNTTETVTSTNQSASSSTSTTAAAVMISYSCIQTMVPFLLSITTSRNDDISFHLAIYHLHCKVITLYQYLTHSYHTYFKGNNNLFNTYIIYL